METYSLLWITVKQVTMQLDVTILLLPVVLYLLLLFNTQSLGKRGGLMVGALDSGPSGPGSNPGRGDIVLCSWVRNLTLTVPLSTQVYCISGYQQNVMLGVTL